MNKLIKIEDIKFECIDPESRSFQVTWGDAPNECTHVFYEYNPRNCTIWFSFEDEDYPEIPFGYIHNRGYVDNGSDQYIIDAMKQFFSGAL